MEFKSGEQGTNGVSGSVLEPFLVSSVHNGGGVERLIFLKQTIIFIGKQGKHKGECR